MSCHLLDRGNLPSLAYVADLPSRGRPTLLFLSGYRSDLNGTKASALAAWAAEQGVNLVRFDYSGHGASAGDFDHLSLSDWIRDANDILDHIVPPGPVILVGSSMGGWIALHLAEQHTDRVVGVIGLAAAPDFTPRLYEALYPDQRAELQEKGITKIEGRQGDAPYVITARLIQDGARYAVLDHIHDRAIPMTLIQGKKDMSVPYQTTTAIAQAYPACKPKIILIDDGDHSLSRPQDLAILYEAVKTHLSAISA